MSVDVSSSIKDTIPAQPDDVRMLAAKERDLLIISSIRVDGIWVIKSQYGDDSWELSGGTTNRHANKRTLDFTSVPPAFQAVAKEVLYVYSRRGREGWAKPSPATMFSTFISLVPFLRYLDSLKIKDLGKVTPMVCATYVVACKAERQTRKMRSPALSAASLQKRFAAVEMLQELSQFTTTPILAHPWPESSSSHLAGLTGRSRRGLTPLIPDEYFTTLFQQAWTLVQRGDALLDLRDGLNLVAAEFKGNPQTAIKNAQKRYLKAHGWDGELRKCTQALNELRTACYIVVASLSGCRNHELAHVQSGACYCTEGDNGEVYWWMRSRSDKSGTGPTEWMVPEAAVEALRVMDRWALPYQMMLTEEIAVRRTANPYDPEISEAQRHQAAVFLGMDKNRQYKVRTLTHEAWSNHLKLFAKRCGLDWGLTSHQFRRKFANYAARSKFGDLRYLREHFKHWSQDMTNDGYALNESQEMELYAEIEDELDSVKFGLAEQWLSPAEPLAGGYGKNLVKWRSRDENIALFKDHASMVRSIAESHAIRSNGHAWCTADDNKCISNTFEKTRCSGCDNAVIGRFHSRLYQRLYEDLKEVATRDDIGRGGQARVIRDMERCRDVLLSLGYDPEAHSA